MVLRSSKVYEESKKIVVKTFSPFKIGIHDPTEIADLRQTGIEIEPGYTSTFLITPSQIVTSLSPKGLMEEQRQCRFDLENGSLRLFKDYSQSGCLLECELQEAYERCQCIPWNYPHLEEDMPICNQFGRDCFETAMSNASSSATCDCPFDCSYTRYRIQHVESNQ